MMDVDLCFTFRNELCGEGSAHKDALAWRRFYKHLRYVMEAFSHEVLTTFTGPQASPQIVVFQVTIQKEQMDNLCTLVESICRRVGIDTYDLAICHPEVMDVPAASSDE